MNLDTEGVEVKTESPTPRVEGTLDDLDTDGVDPGPKRRGRPRRSLASNVVGLDTDGDDPHPKRRSRKRPLLPQRRDGCTSAAESLDFVRDIENSMRNSRPDCHFELLATMQTAADILTDFSGMAMPEQACDRVKHFFPSMVMNHVRACDCDTLCQRVLLDSRYAGDSLIQCVFENILHRVPESIVVALRVVASDARVELDLLKAARPEVSRQDHLRLLTSKVTPVMLNVFKDAPKIDANTTAPCKRHGTRCRLWGHHRHAVPGADRRVLCIVLAGHTCYDWSSLRRDRLGPASESFVVLMVFIFEMLCLLPDAIITECTQLFEETVFDIAFAANNLYIMMCRPSLGPIELGDPDHRQRKWIVFLKTLRLKPMLRFDSHEFADMFFKRPVTSADIFFVAPATYIRKCAETLAEAKGIRVDGADGRTRPFAELLPSPSARRLAGFKKFLTPSAQGLINIHNNASYCHHVYDKVPTWTRTSEPWHLSLQRPMLIKEGFLSMGCNVFGDPRVPPISFDMDAFTDEQLQELLGNSQHMHVVALLLMYVWGCTEKL